MVERRAGPLGVNSRSPTKSKQNCRTSSPREPGKARANPEQPRGDLTSPVSKLDVGVPRFGASVGELRGPYGPGQPLAGYRMGWASSMRVQAVKVNGIHEPGFQQHPHIPNLAPEAWHILEGTNPHKSGQLFPNTTLARPWMWLPSTGRGTCCGLQPCRWLGGQGFGVGAQLRSLPC